MAAAAAALSACGAMKQSEALVRLLNSRSAQSPALYREAAERVARDAETGMPLQRYMLAVLSDLPDVPADIRVEGEKRKAYLDGCRDRIRQLAERTDNALAWYLLSLENNDMECLRHAARGKNVQALNAWGTLLLNQAQASPPPTNVVELQEKSFRCFRLAAAQKDANGLYNLGMCYMHGLGCRPDPALALQSFRSAADCGHPEAINNIGGCFRDGIAVEQDSAEAAKWFRKSADLGDPYGQLNYALALQRGDGVSKDEAAAVELLRLSAAQDCAEAMNVYGMCYYSGRGVARDPALAVAWFRKSAAAGFPPAMENLADCYEKGTGVERDAMQATLWTMRARASRGDAAAAEWLGSMDRKGGARQ